MNTDDLLTAFRSDVPLPDEATARRIYASATSRPTHPPRRRLALVAFAVVICVAGTAVVVSGVLDGPHSRRPIGHGHGMPMGYDPLTLKITRNDQGIASIAVTVNAAVRDATVQLEVLRTQDLSCPGCSRTEQQTVFQGPVEPMTNIAAPAEGPPGVVALSTWSGTLSPSDWSGGCQDGRYSVVTNVSQGEENVERGGSFWFACKSSG